MDTMTYLRLKSILGNQDDGGSSDNQEDQPPDDSQGPQDFNGPQNTYDPDKNNITGRMAQLFQPKNTATQAFSDELSNQPDRSNYAPSKGRKLLAFASGLGTASPMGVVDGQPVGFRGNPEGAYDMARKVTDAPYNAAESQYEQKLKPLAIAASQEEKDNTNNRIAANNQLSREISDRSEKNREREVTRKENHDSDINDQNAAKNDLAQQRIDAKNKALDFLHTHPNYKSFTGKDGYLHFWNPEDPKSPTLKSDVQSGQMNDFDKINLHHDNTLNEIAARKDNSSDLEDQRQKNRLDLKNHPTARNGADIIDSTTTTIAPDAKSKTVTHSRNIKPVVPANNGTGNGTITPPTQTTNQPEDVTKVPSNQRIAGKVYKLTNGTLGKWMGSGFVAVQ